MAGWSALQIFAHTTWHSSITHFSARITPLAGIFFRRQVVGGSIHPLYLAFTGIMWHFTPLLTFAIVEGQALVVFESRLDPKELGIYVETDDSTSGNLCNHRYD